MPGYQPQKISRESMNLTLGINKTLPQAIPGYSLSLELQPWKENI